MLQSLRSRANNEDGFTLVELLVVILIIGILAAIALPTFLGQQKKGQDASAKSDARNLVSHVESCFADSQTYTSCATANLTQTGLKLGTSPGEVNVVPTAAGTGYTVTGYSQSGNTFMITRDAAGVVTRTCTADGVGGCKAGATW